MLIAVVAALFPVPDQPYLGWPVYRTIDALRRFADIHVVSPSASSPWSESAVHLGQELKEFQLDLPVTFFEFPVVPFLTRPWNGAICARFLYPHLARLRPDLILNYWLYPEGYAALKVGRALGIPVIVSSRGSDLRRIPDPLTRRKVAQTVRGADQVLTVSEDLRQQAIRLGAPPHRVTSIPNGTEFQTFYRRNQQGVRQELGVGADEQIVLYIGRFSENAGLIELVTAFARVAADRPRLRLVCLGSGPLRDDMLTCAAVCGIRDRLSLPGDQSQQKALWLNAADLLCLPSYSEECAKVIIEAVSCGCPVVASAVGAIPELVNPQCAVLVPPENVDRLAQGLSEALSHGWDRATISSDFARSWNDVARETFEVCCRTAR